MNSKMAKHLDGREIATLGLHTTANYLQNNHGVNENSLQDIQLLATHLFTTTKVKLILFLSEFINMVHVNARHSGTKNFPEKLCPQCWQQLLELCKA